jgi:hypothetical protein
VGLSKLQASLCRLAVIAYSRLFILLDCLIMAAFWESRESSHRLVFFLASDIDVMTAAAQLIVLQNFIYSVR